jgi:uncharacterized protein (TIGR03000 family)
LGYYRPYGYGYGYGYGYPYGGTANYSYSYPSTVYVPYTPPTLPPDYNVTATVPDQGAPANVAEMPATVEVRVPANAQVWFDSAETQQKGQMRVFASPPIPTGKDYSYNVRAQWMENGRPVDRTQKVHVMAGERSLVDFTNPAR